MRKVGADWENLLCGIEALLGGIKLAIHSPSATKIDNSVAVEQPAIVSTDRIMTGAGNVEDLTLLYINGRK